MRVGKRLERKGGVCALGEGLRVRDVCREVFARASSAAL